MRVSAAVTHFLWVFLLMAGFFACCAYAKVTCAAIPVAQVVWVKGTVKAIAEDKKERILKRSDFIYERDVIKTDAASSGQVVFSDSSLLSLQEKTEFKIDHYKYSKEGPASKNKFIGNLVKGGFRTVTGAVSKDHPENYQVNTPVATIGVRGTQYYVSLSSTNELTIEIEKGTIFVQNEKGETTLDVNALRYATVQSKLSAPTASTVAPSSLKTKPPVESVKPSEELVSAAAVSSNGPSSGTGGSSESSGSSSGGGGGGNCGTLNIGG